VQPAVQLPQGANALPTAGIVAVGPRAARIKKV
jgi:hypothetical protein